jgi:hypothetical protein
MRKVTPYLANGCPKTCWSCSKPFIVREGRGEAVVGHDNRLYCDRTDCEETALVPLVHALRHASVTRRAALLLQHQASVNSIPVRSSPAAQAQRRRPCQ